MREVVYHCDECHAEIHQMVVFDASDNNINDRPTFCRDCAPKEFAKWLETKMGTGSTIVVVNPSLRNIKK